MLPDALDLTGLTVRHGDVLAVDGLDLRIGLRPAGGSVRVLGRTPADAVGAAALAGCAAVSAGPAVLVARRRPPTAVAG